MIFNTISGWVPVAPVGGNQLYCILWEWHVLWRLHRATCTRQILKYGITRSTLGCHTLCSWKSVEYLIKIPSHVCIYTIMFWANCNWVRVITFICAYNHVPHGCYTVQIQCMASLVPRLLPAFASKLLSTIAIRDLFCDHSTIPIIVHAHASSSLTLIALLLMFKVMHDCMGFVETSLLPLETGSPNHASYNCVKWSLHTILTYKSHVMLLYFGTLSGCLHAVQVVYGPKYHVIIILLFCFSYTVQSFPKPEHITGWISPMITHLF